MAYEIRTGDPRGFNKGRSVKVPKFSKHLKKAGGQIGLNVVEITIKTKTIVRKPLMIDLYSLIGWELPQKSRFLRRCEFKSC